MKNSGIVIRKANEADSEKAWVLMRDLAVFENYIETFAITPKIGKWFPQNSTGFSLHCCRR